MPTITRVHHKGRVIIPLPEESLVFGASDTTKNFLIRGNAKVHTTMIDVPNFTNAVPAAIKFTDEDSYDIYELPAMAKNNQHIITGENIGLHGVTTLTITLSGVPGGSGGTVKVKMYLE